MIFPSGWMDIGGSVPFGGNCFPTTVVSLCPIDAIKIFFVALKYSRGSAHCADALGLLSGFSSRLARRSMCMRLMSVIEFEHQIPAPRTSK